MAKQIIVIGAKSDSKMLTVTAAFWFAVTTAKRPQANGSAWTGASAAENTAIQNGDVIEEVQAFPFPLGTLAASIKDFLQQYWTNRNGEIGGKGPAQFAGVFFDSATGWSA